MLELGKGLGMRVPEVNKDEDVLRGDSLERENLAAVAAYRGGKGRGPGVLEADHERRFAGLKRIGGCGRVLLAEHARASPRENQQIIDPIAVEIGDLKPRHIAVGVLLDHEHIEHSDDSAVH